MQLQKSSPQPLMMEMFSETVDTHSILTWPIIQEECIAYGCSENFKSHKFTLLSVILKHYQYKWDSFCQLNQMKWTTEFRVPSGKNCIF
jgi:hypothetical protein